MNQPHKLSTGLAGLDEILFGGFIRQNSYLIRGGPGTGKSTLGYHFLKEAVQNNEQALYITFGEPEERILRNADGMGIDLSELIFLELTPDEEIYRNPSNYTIFKSSEVERDPIVKAVVETFEKHKPSRVFLDSVTMLKQLNQDPFQLRKQALSFIRYICNRGATLLMTSESDDPKQDQEASYWVDGILHLEYSPDWRKLSVTKFRGSNFRDGTHAYKITGNGITVYPRLQPDRYKKEFLSDPLSSGIQELDKMTSGGIEKGTTTLITGPSGVGKTNLGIQFTKEAASRGEHSAIYTFEESNEIITKRSEGINVPIEKMVKNGKLKIISVEPLSYSPDEFSQMVRSDVEENDTKLVMIDTIGAYSLAVREENALERLHSLTVYLQNMGVTTILINETHNITGNFTTTNLNASYLSDNIIFMRYLELGGEIQKVIGVLKKRLSDFERSIRKFDITSDGLVVGEKLSHLQGILTGIPRHISAENIGD
ncbi:MAG: ATPase domain-containing protein [Balneolaceae bacterium]|nr:ATPase domain-containing protein [Balneolaceae bacterium]